MFALSKQVELTLVTINYLVIAYGAVLVCYCLVPQWSLTDTGELSQSGTLTIRMYLALVLYTIVTHLRCMFTDAGRTPPVAVPESCPIEKVRHCGFCDQFKPERTHHCRSCNQCFHRMDHHCPWVYNCVAARTQKYFIQYLVGVAVLSLSTITIVCWAAYWSIGHSEWSLIFAIFVVFGGVLAVLFASLSIWILQDQVESVVFNQSEIEHLNGEAGQLRGYAAIVSSLGSPFSWLNPLSSPPPLDYTESTRKNPEPRGSTVATLFYSSWVFLWLVQNSFVYLASR